MIKIGFATTFLYFSCYKTITIYKKEVYYEPDTQN